MKSIKIGRSSSNDVVINDPTVSAHHAVLTETASGYILKDLNSSNGTFVNGSFVSKAELHTEDTITVGDTNFTFIIIPKPAGSK